MAGIERILGRRVAPPGRFSVVSEKTRRHLYTEVMVVYKDRADEFFPVLYDVEHMDIRKLRNLDLFDTPFYPAAELLRHKSFAVGRTLGDTMDVLGLSRRQIHNIACACTNGGELLGCELAYEFGRLAQQSRFVRRVMTFVHYLIPVSFRTYGFS